MWLPAASDIMAEIAGKGKKKSDKVAQIRSTKYELPTTSIRALGYQVKGIRLRTASKGYATRFVYRSFDYVFNDA